MTRERRRINEVKAHLEEVRRQLREVEADRNLYREAYVRHLKWFIKLLGENKNPSLPWLIEEMSKTLNRATQFFW